MRVKNWELLRTTELKERVEFSRRRKIPSEIQSQNCMSKKKYETIGKAMKACRKMHEKNPDKKFRPYTCPVCRFHHVTSQVK